MRLIGIVLVLLGALALGVEGFGSLFQGRAAAAGPTVERAEANGKSGWVSPVVGGIALVGGLLLLASDGRRD